MKLVKITNLAKFLNLTTLSSIRAPSYFVVRACQIGASRLSREQRLLADFAEAQRWRATQDRDFKEFSEVKEYSEKTH